MGSGKIFGLGLGGCLVILALLVLFCVLCFKGCGSDKQLNVPYTTEAGVQKDTLVTVEQVGLFTMSEKNPNVEYRVVWGNVIIGAIGFETFVLPIKHFGFTLWEPVGIKTGTRIPGTKVDAPPDLKLNKNLPDKQDTLQVLKTPIARPATAAQHL